MSNIVLKIVIEDRRASYKESYDDAATVGNLIDAIMATSGKPQIQLFSGFPPIEIPISCRDASLKDVGVVSGTVVTVRDPPVIVRRVVDSDNSCMFHAISYAMTKDRTKNTDIYRRAVSDSIRRDPDLYSEAVLGRPNAEYAEWIAQSTSWGGEIELGILAKFLGIEIAAVDVQTNNVYTYSPDPASDARIYLLYDGIHYDTLVYAKSEDAAESGDVTQYRSKDDVALAGCKEKARQLKQERQFVDLSGFAITCMVCNRGFHGQAEAAEHAKLTSHQNFAQK